MGSQRNGYLLYVYNPALLKSDWKDAKSRNFLQLRGYDCNDIEGCIDLLSQRIQTANMQCGCAKRMRFPHEVGLFLGYPFHDVEGFVKHAGKNFIACGRWKIYANERETLQRFKSFEFCTAKLNSIAESGAGLEEVIAAAQAA